MAGMSGRSMRTTRFSRPGRTNASSNRSGKFGGPDDDERRARPGYRGVEGGQDVRDDGHPVVPVPAVDGRPVREGVDLVEEQDGGTGSDGLAEHHIDLLHDLVEVPAGRCEPCRNAGRVQRHTERLGQNAGENGLADSGLAPQDDVAVLQRGHVTLSSRTSAIADTRPWPHCMTSSP